MFFFTGVYSHITNIQLKCQVFIQASIICKISMKSHQLVGMFFWQINFIKSPSFFHYTETFFTCEVDMREVSCRPVKSDDEILTGAPRCNLILTFLSRSIPDTGRGEVLAVRKTALDSHNKKWDYNMITGKITLWFAYKNSTESNKRNQGLCFTFTEISVAIGR